MSRLHRMQPVKSLLTVAIVLLLVLFVCESLALSAPLPDSAYLGHNGGDNSHPHNLSSGSASAMHAVDGETDEICIFCHTPHSSSNSGSLWNRPDLTTAFPFYGKDGNILIDDIAEAKYNDGITTYPNGATRLCLSCHDGVTAIGEVISGELIASSLGPMPISSMRIELSTSHPVSFVYNETVRGQLTGKTALYTLPTDTGILDTDRRMQCTSCHDPHVDTRDGTTTYTLPMWRNYTGDDTTVANDYDATCGQCHVGGSNSPGLVDKMPLPLPSVPPIH